MGAFQGFARVGDTLHGSTVVRDAGGDPAAANDDDAISILVYGPDGVTAATPTIVADDDTAGLYHYEIDVLGADGFDAGVPYRVVISTPVGSDRHTDVDSFQAI